MRPAAMLSRGHVKVQHARLKPSRSGGDVGVSEERRTARLPASLVYQ